MRGITCRRHVKLVLCKNSAIIHSLDKIHVSIPPWKGKSKKVSLIVRAMLSFPMSHSQLIVEVSC